MKRMDDIDDRDRERADLLEKHGEVVNDRGYDPAPVICLHCNAGVEFLTPDRCLRCGSDEVL